MVGAGGAGKTTLARELGRVLGLPVVHLDAHYYGPGWQPSDPADWAARHRRLVAGERWVLDGSYAGMLAARLERADMVVFLDLPPLCAWQVVRRWALGRLRPAPDLPAGLRPKLDLGFLVYVLGFRRRRRPALLAELARCPQGRTVVVLRSRRAVRRFLAQLATVPSRNPQRRDHLGGGRERGTMARVLVRAQGRLGVRFLEGAWADVFLWRSGGVRGYSVAIWKHRHAAEPTRLPADQAAGFWLEALRAGAATGRHLADARTLRALVARPDRAER